MTRRALASALVLLGLAWADGGCATSTQEAKPVQEETASAPQVASAPEPGPSPAPSLTPTEEYGPQPVPKDTAGSTYGPEPVQLRPLVLVLGPGMARGFAHVGVLRALNEAKIPVGAILATDVGALVAALYSMNSSINAFDWELQKFKSDAFAGRSALLPALLGRGDPGRLDASLEEVLGEKDLGQGRVPLRVGVLRGEIQELLLLQKGNAAAAVRGALAIPGWLEPAELDSQRVISSAGKHPYPVTEARLLGIGAVVVVDALGDGPFPTAEDKRLREVSGSLSSAARIGRQVLKEADLVLRPNLQGIGFFEFEKRNEAAFLGKTAVQARLQELRHLVGLPVDPTASGAKAAPQ